MMTTNKKATALAATAAIFALSATPAQAGFWSWLNGQICGLGCDLNWVADLADCGLATDALVCVCYLHATSYSIWDEINCMADCGDFRDRCAAIADFDSMVCDVTCV